MHERDKHLLQFSTLPNISMRRRKYLSRTAFMAFFCVEDDPLKANTIQKHLKKCQSIVQTTGERKGIILKKFRKEDMTELLKLPELSCLIYGFKFQDMNTREIKWYYQSIYNSVKRAGDRQCLIYWFRKAIITCIQKAVEERCDDKCGNITLSVLCDNFNKHFAHEYGWECNLEDNFAFFRDKTFHFALCFYCSRDIVIDNPRNTPHSPLLRLRNHPNYLFQQIEKEQVLAKNVSKAFNQYYDENPDEIIWFKLVPDLRFTEIEPDLTDYVSYPATLSDNIFAAIHYHPGIINFKGLMKFCNAQSKSNQSSSSTETTPETSTSNILVEILSPKSLMPIKSWDLQKQKLFAKIINDYLIMELDETSQNCVLEQLEKTWVAEFK